MASYSCKSFPLQPNA